MKLVLLKDDKKYGKKGDIVNVSDGFANNYLIPNKIAAPATSGHVSEAKQMKDSQKFHQQEELDAAKQLALKLKDVVVDLKIKAGENGKVFGSITSKEISQGLSTLGFEVDRKKIELDSPIKTVGAFAVKAKVHREVTAKFKVNVLPE